MAILIQNMLLKGLSGSLGKAILIRQFRGKTIISKYPDRQVVRATALQKKSNHQFKLAVAYARGINNHPKKRALLQKKLKPGESVYHRAIKDFMKRQTRRPI